MNPETKPRDPDEFYDRREKNPDEAFCYACGSISKRGLCPHCGTIVNYPYFKTQNRTDVATAILFSILISSLSMVFIIFAISTIAITSGLYIWLLVGLIPIISIWLITTFYVLKKDKPLTITKEDKKDE
jgi:hypothetical protein